MSRPLDSLGSRLRHARKQRQLNQDQLAAATGETQPTISKIERGDILQPTSIARLAHVLRVPPLWLELGNGPEPDWTGEQHSGGLLIKEPVAQYLSQINVEDAPSIEWGAHMNADSLPDVFWIALPDDAMAPRAAAGKLVCFDRRMVAKPGDGVLVVDANDALYVRQYRAGAVGRWAAHALNAAYEPMDSQAHGLRVVAVLKAEEGRWA